MIASFFSTLPCICNQGSKLARVEMREKAEELPVNLQSVSWSLTAGGGAGERTAVQPGASCPNSMARRQASTAALRSVMRGDKYFCTSRAGLPKCEKIK